MKVGIEIVALTLVLLKWLAYKGLIVSSPQHFIQSVVLEHVRMHTHTHTQISKCKIFKINNLGFVERRRRERRKDGCSLDFRSEFKSSFYGDCTRQSNPLRVRWSFKLGSSCWTTRSRLARCHGCTWLTLWGTARVFQSGWTCAFPPVYIGSRCPIFSPPLPISFVCWVVSHGNFVLSSKFSFHGSCRYTCYWAKYPYLISSLV